MENKIIEKIAEKAHQMLVAHRLLLDPRPYTKTTTDEEWIKKHGTNTVDLSKSVYEDLPLDWKSERDKGATIAYEKVNEKLKEKSVCYEQDIEEIANILHEKWLERNNMRASAEQKNRYEDMTEYEKEKDRIFVKATLEIVNNKI
jgi:hypothetical protein